MKYTIIATTDAQDLVNEVNQQLRLGWLPQGGVMTRTLGRHQVELIQAMVKEED